MPEKNSSQLFSANDSQLFDVHTEKSTLEDFQPLVSVIITSYNYEQFIARAIDSVLEQTYTSTEIIVVDDGSQDNSIKIIQSYGNKIIPILKSNGGEASATNAGMAASSGSIICFLDADDMFSPEKVANVVNALRIHPESGWCFHSLQVLSKTNPIKEETFTGNVQIWDLVDSLKKGKMTTHLSKPVPPTSGLSFRRSLLKQILPIPENIKIVCDSYMQFVALGLSKGVFIDLPLAYYRHHGNNAYAENPQKPLLEARMHVLTGYWIRLKFPSLSCFADNIMAAGLGTYWKLGKMTPEEQELVNHHLNSVPLYKKWEIYLRAIFNYALYEIRQKNV